MLFAKTKNIFQMAVGAFNADEESDNLKSLIHPRQYMTHFHPFCDSSPDCHTLTSYTALVILPVTHSKHDRREWI